MARDAQHGDVEVEAVERLGLEVLPVGLQQIAGVVLGRLAVAPSTSMTPSGEVCCS